MGPAAAFDAMADPAVTRVGVADASEAQLEGCLSRLAGRPGAEKLVASRVDVGDEAGAARLLADFDAVVSALPTPACGPGIRAALRAGVPMVTLTWPAATELPALEHDAEARRVLVVLGCGLEPGLTEILARHLAEQVDRVDELHIKCGGIPATPAGPLGYKIVFGGRRLPLRETDVNVVLDGQVRQAPRYSEVEPVRFPGVGLCEAWHEGFRTSLLEVPALRALRVGTQKTVRWPGYAAKVTALKELGLLGLAPVTVDGVAVVPKHVVDAVLYPRVRLEPGEADLTLFRVDVLGEAGGRAVRRAAVMVDRYDPLTGFTSMARTTSFTAAIVARMAARRELDAVGVKTPEALVIGPHLDRLLRELAAHGVRFTLE
jgi:saccharopine dehydrogenase-like NADP-dependent oxidoreductase